MISMANAATNETKRKRFSWIPNYRLHKMTREHTVPVIGQEKTMGCWLASFAMVNSWKLNRNYSLAQMEKFLGDEFELASYKNTGINADQAKRAALSIGLTMEPPSNPSLEKWIELADISPLFVITKEPLDNRFAIHARVVTGITKVPSSSLAEVKFIDPGANNLTGGRGSIGFRDFVKYFEGLAGGSLLGVQLLRF